MSNNVVRWRELPDGFAFELSGDDDTAHRLFDMIVLERRCCTFVRFTLVFEPNGGPLHLEMRSDPVNQTVLRELLEPTGAMDAPRTP